MCNILVLEPGVMPDYDEFKNMCYNNWHSYGLVTRVADKLDIKKHVPASGEINPDELWDLVGQDVDFKRYVHVRHNTAGATTVENAHPFDVFYSGDKQIVFMHNGTLYPYKSKKKNNLGQLEDDDTGPSDTKNFVDQILTPYIAASDFGNGKGDLASPELKRLLDAFWITNNRGILIANDQDHMLLGTINDHQGWKTKKNKAGQEFLTSNVDYFMNVTRGPEFSRRAAQQAKAKAATASTANKTGTNVIPFAKLEDFNFKKRHGFYELGNSLVNILSDWNVYDRSGAITLGNATRDELIDLYANKQDCISVMDWVFSDYANMYVEMMDLEDKHDKSSKKVASLVNEIKALKAELRGFESQVGNVA